MTKTIYVKLHAPEITNLYPQEDIHVQTGETVKIEFTSEPELHASYVIHMPLTNFGAKLANVTVLPLIETTPGHYVGYYTVTNNVNANGAQIEVIVQDDFGNTVRKKTKGKLYIQTER